MTEDQLIFLISQPRSGSSMVQQLLLNSNEISSCPESWLMLSLVYTFKKHTSDAGYNPKFAVNNFNRFLESTKMDLSGYKSKVKNLSLELYSEKMESGSYFLDKTPRYYHIIDELYELFPKAKFIFLTRNPLSVFSSMLDYNFKGDYSRFLGSPDRLEDIFLAPEEIGRAVQKYPNHVLVSYEEIVRSPETEMKKLFDYLAVDNYSGSSYEIKGEFTESSARDTKSLQMHTSPVSDYIESWKKVLDTTQKKKLAIEYLKRLQTRGPYFHYEIHKLLKELRQHKPGKRTYFNIPFELLIREDQKLSTLEIIKKRFLKRIQNLQGA